jgi:hypothetical protein
VVDSKKLKDVVAGPDLQLEGEEALSRINDIALQLDIPAFNLISPFL